MNQSDKCAKGHSDWVITDPDKGWRRCRTCQRIGGDGSRKTKRSASAFGLDATGKRQYSRGSGEDTWSRTELLRFRGYDV